MPPRLQPTSDTGPPLLPARAARVCGSRSSTALVGPTFRPRSQPRMLWPSQRRNLRSRPVLMSEASSPGTTSTPCLAPRGAEASHGAARGRTARPASPRAGSVRKSPAEGPAPPSESSDSPTRYMAATPAAWRAASAGPLIHLPHLSHKKGGSATSLRERSGRLAGIAAGSAREQLLGPRHGLLEVGLGGDLARLAGRQP